MTPTTETASPGQEPVRLTRAHYILIAVVAAGASVIAAIGFAGSYNAVRKLAERQGFGAFAPYFPIGIDAGIVVLLALDMLLAWIRMPFPLLRQTAWVLTAATIAFNGAAAWPDPLGVGMHAAIPVLFIVSVEAARHAFGRIANITADKHTEPVPGRRWLIDPAGSFVIWRRMGMYGLRSYQQVIDRKRELKVYTTELRKKCGGGRGWKASATADELLPLDLAPYGVSVAEALAIPARKAEEAQQRKRAQERADQTHRNAMAAEEDDRRQAEAERRRREEEEQRQQTLADARHTAELAAIARREQQQDAEVEAAAWARRQQQRETEATATERAAIAAKARADALRAQQEEINKARILDAQRRTQGATPPPQAAPQAAPQSATTPATVAPRPTPQSAPQTRHQSATSGATTPATKTPRKRPTGRHEPPTRSAIKTAVRALYDTHGRRPLEGEIVDELKRIGSQYDSRAFAQKIRGEIEHDDPRLAELGSDNVRALNQTGS